MTLTNMQGAQTMFVDFTVGKSVFIIIVYITEFPTSLYRDLSENGLTSLPVGGLGGLTHLKLKGNMELYEDFSPELFTRMRYDP